MMDVEEIMEQLLRSVRSRQEHRGINPNQLENIQTIKFKKDPLVAPGEEEKCPICCAEFEDDESLSKLECTHLYHKECINTWLVRNATCPVCKRDVGGPRNHEAHSDEEEETRPTRTRVQAPAERGGGQARGQGGRGGSRANSRRRNN